MVRLEKKEIIKAVEKIDADDTVDNKLDLAVHISKVQSRIKDEISSDFVYAKLGEKDREAIIEMVGNAYYSKKLIEVIRKSCYRWEWNIEERCWEKLPLPDYDQRVLHQFSSNIFDAFMTKMFMVALLNRNVKDNHLIKHSVGIPEEEGEGRITEEEMKGFGEKLKNAFKNEETK